MWIQFVLVFVPLPSNEQIRWDYIWRSLDWSQGVKLFCKTSEFE
mgnify:CR=1 FL=1